ncbi:hypothetical protein [Sphingopyxis witflariensis]|uniref:Lipoprotein n=1 Tax=Sphingopyxis witflariensis TaxID=173675 RepID=A0A246JY41_9SPHN|nr:hypothetical protein [Sphingopyxis witflariensis]OWQ97979.1 hypothetical protein CDQ91_10185 [Sphingopyxis witflariensis]
MIRGGQGLALATALLVLSGCAPSDARDVIITYDRNVEAVAFKECMAALPEGPTATQYNDWDEVVDKCRDYAYGQAKRCVGTVEGCGFYGMTPDAPQSPDSPHG